MSKEAIETVSITPLDVVSAETALVVIDLIMKGYKVKEVRCAHGDEKEEVTFWSYRWQTPMKVVDGALWVQSKGSVAWSPWIVQDMPEEWEPQIGDALDSENDFKIIRDTGEKG